MPNRHLKPVRGAGSVEPEQFYRRIAETIPHMVWGARPDGRLDYFNSRVFAYTGRTARQLEGSGWRSVIHPEDLERCLDLWTRALKSGQPYEIEYRLKRHDGTLLWHLGAAMPLRQGARIVRWFGTCTDVESQKKAERLLDQARKTLESLVASRTQALEQSDQRLRTFLDSLPAIAWIKDSRLRYAWVSASYGSVHGKSLRELQGRDDFDIWPEALARQFRRDDEKALRANGPMQSVDSMPYADGGAARWLVVKFPMPDETGALGVAGIGFDIAARGPGDTGIDTPDAANPLERLSGRESQVLRLMVEGCTSAEIAERVNLSPKSVDTYRSRVMTKLEIEDLPGLVKFAIRHRITTTR